MLASILMFLAPVFYPVSALPDGLEPLIYLNPLTYVIEQARGVIFAGVSPEPLGLAVFYGVSLAVAQFGYLTFQKSRRGFSDVL